MNGLPARTQPIAEDVGHCVPAASQLGVDNVHTVEPGTTPSETFGTSHGVDGPSLNSRSPRSSSSRTSSNPPTSNPCAVLSAPDRFGIISTNYYNQLSKKFYHNNEPHKRFVPAGTAQEFLTEERLADLFSTVLEEARVVRLVNAVKEHELENMVAALIQIGWGPNDLLRLESRYAEARSEVLPYSNLELPKTVAIDMFGDERGSLFFDAQFYYIPFTLVEGEHNVSPQVPGRPYRLPFIKVEAIGGGDGGVILKVLIAKNGWRYPDLNTNAREKWVVLKRFNGETRDDRKRFCEAEVEIYKKAEKNARHNNLARYFGSLEEEGEGNGFGIFLPCADYSLETLLTTNYLEMDSPADIFAYAAGLCSGLNYLHHGLHEEGKPFSVLHLDFKPLNILVYLEADNEPVWRIADFGLSKEKPRYQHSNMTTAPWSGGTFASPEAHANFKVTIAHDLWALGAVLVEVLTFAVGGPTLVQEFRTMRHIDPNSSGQDHGHDRFFEIQHKKYRVSSKVTEWCERLRENAGSKDHTLGEVIDIALSYLQKHVLVIDQEERKKTRAEDVGTMLYYISQWLRDGHRPKQSVFDIDTKLQFANTAVESAVRRRLHKIYRGFIRCFRG